MTPEQLAEAIKHLAEQVPEAAIDQAFIDATNTKLEELNCAIGIKPAGTPTGSPTGGN